MKNLIKNDARREVAFWSSVSDLDDGILDLMVKFGYSDSSIYRQLEKLISDERKIANVEL